MGPFGVLHRVQADKASSSWRDGRGQRTAGRLECSLQLSRPFPLREMPVRIKELVCDLHVRPTRELTPLSSRDGRGAVLRQQVQSSMLIAGRPRAMDCSVQASLLSGVRLKCSAQAAHGSSVHNHTVGVPV